MKFKDLEKQAQSQTVQKTMFVLPSLAAGGAERVLITLMNKLDRSKFQPEFISLKEEGPLSDLIAEDVTVHKIGNYSKVIFGLIPLLFRLRKQKPDVIVTTMAHMNYGLLLLKPFLPRKTRLIVREAITPSFIFDTMKSGWVAKILYKALYPRADLVISPAQRIIDEFRDLVKTNTANHKLLYNPVNIAHICDVPQILQKIDDERSNTVHFVCAGRLHPQKGFDRLINSLPYYKSEYDWKLTILGGGDEREKLEALIEKYNFQDKVFLPGFTDKPWPQVGAADCFLLPSRFEGLPNVALESLAVGTPVISTAESGGIEEIAALAPEGAVEVVYSMPDMIEAMRSVKPNPTRVFRNSLLPPTFHPDMVLKRFTDMVEGNDEFDPIVIKQAKKKFKKAA